MATFIEERQQLQAKFAADREAAGEVSALRAKSITEGASETWESLRDRVVSILQAHKTACSKSPQKQVVVNLVEDNFLHLTGSVVRPVRNRWFSAPQSVELDIHFEATDNTVCFYSSGFSTPDSIFFEMSRHGTVIPYIKHKPQTVDKAAEYVASLILDVVDPVR